MHQKVLQMVRLMEAGYAVEEITSDGHGIVACLTGAPGRRVMVSFTRSDAERLLYDATAFAPEQRARPAKSRWLVTQPLR